MQILFNYNLRSLTQRKGRTALTALGVALVVAIFILMTSVAGGLISSFQTTGLEDNILVLQKGALFLDGSSLPKPFLNLIKYVKHVKLKSGKELAAPEAFISTWVARDDKEYSIMVRGVEPLAYDIHNQIRIIAGRKPEFAGEIIIGKMVPFLMGGKLGIGDTLKMYGSKWRIVGIFEDPGSTHESEIWTSLSDLSVAANQDTYSCLMLKVDQVSNVPEVYEILNNSKQTPVKALPEREYYTSVSTMFVPMKIMGLLITFIAGLGAVFVGINTMFSAVMGRIREIGTLRALGFSKQSILLSFILEAFIIAFIGGIIGVLLTLPLNGVSMNMLIVAFQFKIGIGAISQGLLLACVLGILGGIFPARRAAKLEIIEAIRHI